MIHAFAFQRIQPHPRNVAAHEAAGVRGVVNSRHDEAEHAHRQRIAERFGAYEAAAAAATVIHQRAEQAEDRRGRADGHGAAAEEWDGQVRAHE